MIGKGRRQGFALALVRVLLLLVTLAVAGCDRAAAPTAAPSAQPAATVVRAEAPTDLPGLSRVADDERGVIRRTVALIRTDGPFPYPKKDGSTFGNRERRLPIKPRGYYREYTVPTPGLSHRGARRIVGGRAGDLHYTRDHYKTFIRLTP